MAEARKEIVTALKFHRASMKQQQQQQLTEQSDNKQQTPPPPPPISPPPPPSTNHCFYTNSTTYPMLSTDWAPPTIMSNHTSVHLPDQTLGLNLNFQGFSDMDASSLYSHHQYQAIDTPSSSASLFPCFSPPSSLSQQLSPSSFSSSSSPPPPLDLNYNNNSLDFFNTLTADFHLDYHHTDQLPVLGDAAVLPLQILPETNMTMSATDPSIETSSHHQLSSFTLDQEQGVGTMNNLDEDVVDLHPRGLDDEQMEEIRTIGKKHQIEWSDTLSLVNSAWWSKFLNSVETGTPLNDHKEADDIGSPEEAMPYGYESLSAVGGLEMPCMDNLGFEQGLEEEYYWLS